MNVLEQRQAEAVVSIAKTLRTPDWEQRRYELAKAAMVGLMAGHQAIYEAKKLASIAVQYADALIEELKKVYKQAHPRA